MEGYFGNNSDFNYAVPPLNLSNDNISLFASPRDYDLVPRVRRYDESLMLRYLLSGSSSSDENTTPRNRSATISSDQLRLLSSGSSGGCLSLRGSPLSPLQNVENSPRRRSELASSAVKIEEDVLVMDAIPVRSVARAGGGSRNGRNKSQLSLSSDSIVLPSSSPLTGYSGLHKREICRSWEDLGACRYGPKCMFAHGKEEIDPRIITKTKSEMAHCKEEKEMDPRIIRKAKSEFAHGKEEIDPHIISKSKSEIAHPKENIDPRIIISKAKSEVNMCKSPSIASLMYDQKNCSTYCVNLAKKQEQNRESSPSVKYRDWSPMDDGIELKLPYPAKNPPSREAAERKRLPVFEEICPNASQSST